MSSKDHLWYFYDFFSLPFCHKLHMEPKIIFYVLYIKKYKLHFCVKFSFKNL